MKILQNNGVYYIDDSVRICRKTNPNNLESNGSEHSVHMYRREPERFNELVKIERYVNASSGFPYWRFDFWKSNA